MARTKTKTVFCAANDIRSGLRTSKCASNDDSGKDYTELTGADYGIKWHSAATRIGCLVCECRYLWIISRVIYLHLRLCSVLYYSC